MAGDACEAVHKGEEIFCVPKKDAALAGGCRICDLQA
jgi:hypothetical protein